MVAIQTLLIGPNGDQYNVSMSNRTKIQPSLKQGTICLGKLELYCKIKHWLVVCSF